MNLSQRKPLYWIASSRKDLKAMPVPVQKKFGTALLDVQYGDTPVDAKRDIDLMRNRYELAREHHAKLRDQNKEERHA